MLEERKGSIYGEEQSDLKRFLVQVQTLRERLQHFEEECQRNFDTQMATLEELLRWCDYMLYTSSELYYKCTEEKGTAPENH